MYAGVPLICIPKSGDQKYNASIVESKGVGIYVDYEQLKDYTESLGAALYQILNIDEEGNFNFNSKYSKKAEKMRDNILRIYEQKTMKDKFLGKF
uniref:glucuronosyltransferase n=1 Tax=Meloidogyne incognita TaxID=6306 RepID=A0A914LA79_MELIC